MTLVHSARRPPSSGASHHLELPPCITFKARSSVHPSISRALMPPRFSECAERACAWGMHAPSHTSSIDPGSAVTATPRNIPTAASRAIIAASLVAVPALRSLRRSPPISGSVATIHPPALASVRCLRYALDHASSRTHTESDEPLAFKDRSSSGTGLHCCFTEQTMGRELPTETKKWGRGERNA